MTPHLLQAYLISDKSSLSKTTFDQTSHVLGMVRQWQTLFYGKRYSQTELYDQMDFVKVAEGMGAKAYRITKKEDVEPVLREAISLNIPVMIECQIGSDDKVFPMVPAGKPIEEAFDEIDLRIE